MSAAETLRYPLAFPELDVQSVDPSELTDEQILSRYRRMPDEGLFAEFVRRHGDDLRRYLRRMLRDEGRVDDVLQWTWLRVHDRRMLYQDGHRARPWLYAIASHLAVDALRQASRHGGVSLDSPSLSPPARASRCGPLARLDHDPLDRLLAVERAEWLHRAVAGLPPALRGLVSRVYEEGLGLAEVAALEGVPLGTVKSRLHSALQRLRARARRDHVDFGDATEAA